MPMNPRLLRPLARRQAGTPASLLLHFDGNFTDSSANGLTVTAEGDAVTSTAQSKFGGASGLFGIGDYLAVPKEAAEFSTDDFTVEMWTYVSATQTSGFPCVFSNYSSYGANALALFATTNVTAANKWILTYDGVFPGIESTNDIPRDEWAHVAVVRNGNLLTLYVNGVSEGSADVSGSNFTGNATVWYINGAGDELASNNCMGYIDDLRIVKGLAVYTGPFTPPTAPLPVIATPQPVNVSLLLHFDGDNESTVFTDSSVNALTVTANGDAEISTAQSKFGGSSLLLSSSGSLDITPAFSFGAGDFTVEAWLYATGSNAFSALIEFGDHLSGTGLILLPTADATALAYAGGWLVDPPTAEPAANEWSHFAAVRMGGVLYFYLNGVQVGSQSFSNNLTDNSTVRIGNTATFLEGPGYQYVGYIDDLRITKAALYCDNFTPPTAPLTATVMPPNCPAPACDPYGTYLREECQGCDYGTVYADGACGEYFDAWGTGYCC